MTKPSAKILKLTKVFNGFLSVSELEIEADRHDGGKKVFKWQVMERGHAVTMLGYDPIRDEVVLGNEMRPGVLVAGDYPYTDNLPAGGMAKGENAIDTAVREMKEETGLDLKDPVVVHPGLYVSSGGTSEKIAIVFGVVDMTKAGGVHGLVSEGESIGTVVLKADEFLRRVRSAEINDMKTAVAGYWLAENRDRIRRDYAPKAACPKGPTAA
jgi:ADP-ribose pyrophosphatase